MALPVFRVKIFYEPCSPHAHQREVMQVEENRSRSCILAALGADRPYGQGQTLLGKINFNDAGQKLSSAVLA
jgi:hypothetical protein